MAIGVVIAAAVSCSSPPSPNGLGWWNNGDCHTAGHCGSMLPAIEDKRMENKFGGYCSSLLKVVLLLMVCVVVLTRNFLILDSVYYNTFSNWMMFVALYFYFYERWIIYSY